MEAFDIKYILKVFFCYSIFCYPGAKEILPFREEACSSGTAEYAERSVRDYHCWVVEGPRVVEKLDQVLVRSKAWAAAAV